MGNSRKLYLEGNAIVPVVELVRFMHCNSCDAPLKFEIDEKSTDMVIWSATCCKRLYMAYAHTVTTFVTEKG